MDCQFFEAARLVQQKLCKLGEQEVNRAREHLRQEVVTLAIAGAEKVLKREVDASAHESTLNDLATQL